MYSNQVARKFRLFYKIKDEWNDDLTKDRKCFTSLEAWREIIGLTSGECLASDISWDSETQQKIDDIVYLHYSCLDYFVISSVRR